MIRIPLRDSHDRPKLDLRGGSEGGEEREGNGMERGGEEGVERAERNEMSRT